ncbi:hypothetical protein [Streptomyces sp. SKN60]|uniref:hypothetical protein n=1 Tax=Streptomyces sp. SKN60 TaxID=2855506 RepID=UPI002246D0F8|nr:hypothetical protein [Streptomyces sp. SKN60]
MSEETTTVENQDQNKDRDQNKDQDQGQNGPELVEPPAVAETPAPRAPRRLFPYVLTGVLVLGVGAGATFTGVTVAGADRHAPTVAWEEPPTPAKDPAANAADGRASTPLSKLLLPVPEGYGLGPDVEEFGNDGEVSAKDAVALVKQSGKGLSGKKRREFDKRIEKLGIQGIAVRSYASDDANVVLEVQVVRMKNKRFGAEMHKMRNELAGLLKFPKGPKIAGHKNATCWAMPKPKGEHAEESLDGMVCSAYDSEYSVTVTASGSRPFDKSAVAELVKKQLDHIKSPGEYV